MKRIVLTFGLLAGGVLSVMMVVSMAFFDQIGMDRAEVLGYTTMVAAFLMVFFAIRSYRDNVMAGEIGFGRAFQVGLLVTCIASVCYVATWQVVYRQMVPDFMEKYAAQSLEKARSAGATAEELRAKEAEMTRFQELYRNPVVNVAMTFLEPLPVGLVISLVSAGLLSRRRKQPDGRAVASVSTAT